MTNTAELKEVMTEIIYEQGLDKIFIEQGEYNKAVNIAKEMLKLKLSMEDIARCTGLPMEVIKNL